MGIYTIAISTSSLKCEWIFQGRMYGILTLPHGRAMKYGLLDIATDAQLGREAVAVARLLSCQF